MIGRELTIYILILIISWSSGQVQSDTVDATTDSTSSPTTSNITAGSSDKSNSATTRPTTESAGTDIGTTAQKNLTVTTGSSEVSTSQPTKLTTSLSQSIQSTQSSLASEDTTSRLSSTGSASKSTPSISSDSTSSAASSPTSQASSKENSTHSSSHASEQMNSTSSESDISSTTSQTGEDNSNSAGGVSSSSSSVTSSTTLTTTLTTTVHFTTTADECNPSPCKNGGTCKNVNGTSYNCACSKGWKGMNCTVDIDECADGTHNCNNLTSTCNNTEGSYACHCKDGHFKEEKICRELDTCAVGADNCSKTENCENLPGYQNFKCECKSKYYRNKAGVCVKVYLYKYDLKYNETFKPEYNDKSSSFYTDKVKKIITQVKQAGNVTNVTVECLREGSVIAETYLTARENSSDFMEKLESDNVTVTKLDLTPADYCRDINSECDSQSTDCVGYSNGHFCKCKDGFKKIPGTTKYCRDDRRKTCEFTYCKNQGTCGVNGGALVCSCTEEYTGEFCQERIVKKTKYDDLIKIFIGVTAGLGSLALFCFLALIVFCCTEKKGAKYSSASREPIDDDITIHNWMPSLPRPKIKPGSFADDSMEMNESQPTKRPSIRPQPGTDNPAFIPEADYDLDRYEGRHAINGKRNDYVYL